jgi:hypothetical protein
VPQQRRVPAQEVVILAAELDRVVLDNRRCDRYLLGRNGIHRNEENQTYQAPGLDKAGYSRAEGALSDQVAGEDNCASYDADGRSASAKGAQPRLTARPSPVSCNEQGALNLVKVQNELTATGGDKRAASPEVKPRA